MYIFKNRDLYCGFKHKTAIHLITMISQKSNTDYSNDKLELFVTV